MKKKHEKTIKRLIKGAKKTRKNTQVNICKKEDIQEGRK